MKLPIGDVFFLSLRMTVAAYIFYNFGWITGVIICSMLNFVHNQLMWYIFGLESLSAVDEMFVNDDEKNVANIVSKYNTQNYTTIIICTPN